MKIIYKIIILIALLASSSNCFSADSDVWDSHGLIKDGYTALLDGDTTKAFELFNLINPNDSNYSISIELQASILNYQKKYNEIIDVVNLGLACDNEEEYNFLILKGNAYVQLEEYKKALAIYQEGVIKFPFNHIFSYNIAVAYKGMENYDKSIEYLKKALAIYPFYPAAHRELGYIAMMEGKTSQALMAYVMSIILDPAADKSNEVLATMDAYVTQKTDMKSVGYDFPDDRDDFSEIDQVIKSYAALQKGYKVKSKADLNVIRQIQVMLETLEYDKSDKGYWMQFYVQFYKKLWKADMFESFSYFILKASKSETHKKLVSKKIKLTDEFSTWAGNAITSYFNSLPIEVQGKSIITNHFYQSDETDCLSSLGVEKNGVKVGCWYEIYANGKISSTGCFDDQGNAIGEFVYYDKKGEETKSFTLVDGKINGEYKLKYSSGSVFKTLTFKDDDIEGSSVEYHKAGGVFIERNYSGNEIQGEAKRYYSNGNIQYAIDYKDGELHGVLKEFYLDGKIKEESNYVNGTIEGESKEYYINGQLASIATYKDGELDGEATSYFINGQLKIKGVYEAGVLIGTKINYHSNGNLKGKVLFDENGKKSGVIEDFDFDGVKYSELDYTNGNVVGYRMYNKAGDIISEGAKQGGDFQFKGISPDGVLKTEGLYNSKGGKEGVWKYYDNNGNLNEESEFEKGEQIGVQKTYHVSGDIKRLSHFEDGSFNGKYLEFYHNDVPKYKGVCVDNDLNGAYIEYADDGTIIKTLYYQNGQIHGKQLYYAVNGKVSHSVLYDYGDFIEEVHYDTLEMPYDTVHFINLTGELRTKYPDGKANHVADYKNGVSNGKAAWYYGTGQVSLKGNYLNDERIGEWLSYYSNGQLAKRTNYKLGTIHGEVIKYHLNGKVDETYNYEYGTLVGTRKDFHDNGQLMVLIKYELGERHGKGTYYSRNGSIEHFRFYNYGKIIGYSHLGPDGKELPMIKIENETVEVKSYFKNGQLSRSYQIKNGDFTGDYLKFYESGKPYEKLYYLHDEAHKARIRYYENGKVWKTSPFVNGELNGTVKTYYNNGVLKSETPYVQSETHGVAKKYSRDGKLLLEEYFYDGGLFSSKRY
ncbi:MAG: tetratricopeptide repeat protein [Flavobacteriales bacterium]|nr:tetratricopeptide repeat protein [Flavobacteriales bacterium]